MLQRFKFFVFHNFLLFDYWKLFKMKVFESESHAMLKDWGCQDTFEFVISSVEDTNILQ